MHVPMIKALFNLWEGRLPLPEAFWTYAIFWGALLNLAATIGFLSLLVIGGGTDPPSWAAPLALLLHLAPIPFNVLILVGVWRSAGRPDVTPTRRLLARCAVLVWAAGLTLI